MLLHVSHLRFRYLVLFHNFLFLQMHYSTSSLEIMSRLHEYQVQDKYILSRKLVMIRKNAKEEMNESPKNVNSCCFSIDRRTKH